MITTSIRFFSVYVAALAFVVLSSTMARGYDVWLGLPYFPQGADDTRRGEWELLAPMLNGLNPNLSQSKLPVEERNTVADWRRIIGLMQNAKNNAMTPMPRTHFNYAGRTDRGTLSEYLTRTFGNESRYGYKIRWVMPFDNQPNENRTLPVVVWSDAELQEMRDWLDSTGRADTRIMVNIRNNGLSGRNFTQKPLVSGYSIEARARLWFEGTGNRPAFLRWAVSNPSTSDKQAKFQVPFGPYQNMDGYQAMRVFMRWLVTDVLDGSTELLQRDDVTFLSIVYDPTDSHFPEKSADGSSYEPTTTSVLLSIIEQKSLFDGTAPGGLITVEQAMSYDRFVVAAAPAGTEHGLVAHWPLDEGSGTVATDAASDGLFDGELLNGASWGSDSTRSSYVIFDGENDRVATPFTYALSSTDDFTWSWWANKEDPAGIKNGSIMVGNRFGGTGAENFEFVKLTPSQGQFANTDSSSAIERYLYPSQITNNGWNHYAMVKSGTSYQWYVNGIAQGPPVTISYSEPSPLPFFIGGDGDDAPNEHFRGGIDDVALYRSALTPTDIGNVMNGIYLQTIPMVALGSSAVAGEGSTWLDGLAPHGGANYLVPATGNLRSDTGTSTFSGASLTVEAGGRFQVRSFDGDNEITTVNRLILAGGASFAAGQFAELAAGTGTNATNVINGQITQSGATRILTFGGTINRRLKIDSVIEGSGTLQLVGHSAIISNVDNSFAGKWEVENDALLTFVNAESVGLADIEVLSGAGLEIQGHWEQNAELIVADSAMTSVELGNFSWTLSRLEFGGFSVPGGTYRAAELNAFGSNAVFSGNGIVRIMPTGTSFESITYNTIGTTNWVCPEGVTSIQVECWGGGGAGGSSSSTGAGQVYVTGGGGAGGSYARRSIVPVTPGRSYAVTIPPAAQAPDPRTASTGDRTDGADVHFVGDNGVLVLARGGQGGQSVINPATTQGGIGGIGQSTGSISDGLGYVFAGGTGNFPLTKGGSGGGGAGRSEAGEDATLEDLDDLDSPSVPGVGGQEGGGDGGQGANFVADGGDGYSPGGGGGGARAGRFATTSGADLLKRGGAGGLGQITISYLVLPDTTSNHEDWRMRHFGTTADSGTAADRFDANSDGESNLLEFATGQDPYAATRLSTPLELEGEIIEYRYPRSKTALLDGMNYQVEWSDTLLEGSWNTAGVIDSLDSSNPGNSEIENRVVTLPLSPNGKRFIRLKVSP